MTLLQAMQGRGAWQALTTSEPHEFVRTPQLALVVPLIDPTRTPVLPGGYHIDTTRITVLPGGYHPVYM